MLFNAGEILFIFKSSISTNVFYIIIKIRP